MLTYQKSAKLVRPSQVELEKRADALALRLGMTREKAFRRMDAGKLPQTIAVTELKLVRHLLMDGLL
jgi:hypothetical protein